MPGARKTRKINGFRAFSDEGKAMEAVDGAAVGGPASVLVGRLHRRVEVVSRIARVAADLDATTTAGLICEAIFEAYERTPVSLYACQPDGSPVYLAGSGREPSAFLGSEGRQAGDGLSQRARRGPWIESEGSWKDGVDALTPLGWACAPLWRGRTPFGVLAVGVSSELGGAEAGFGIGLAAAVDFATAATSPLRAALVGGRGGRRRRDTVEDIVDRPAFHPVFQSIVDLQTGAVVGFEALTRFSDGVPPDDRLAEAAEVGFADELELAMLVAACAAGVDLPAGGWLSVNVSPSMLVRHSDDLAGLADSSPRPLVLELNEYQPIGDPAAVRDAVARIGRQVRLSLDVDGADYAALRHVVDLRPRFLKLDRSWIGRIDADRGPQALVAGVVAFTRHMEVDLVAEGIETAEELRVLQDLGVRLGQGNLLGVPAQPPLVRSGRGGYEVVLGDRAAWGRLRRGLDRRVGGDRVQIASS
jgi:EAL domain-containing protein (putative c-di-GMP-specific phosphodiesterase class I)